MAVPRPAPAQPLTSPDPGHRAWLLFVHQLPSAASNLRVTTWRRLQQIGAVPLKQAVYVLPDTPDTREDFEWLRTEVASAGGEATVFAGQPVDAWSDDELVEAFRRARQDAYAELAADIEQALKRVASPRRARGTRAPAAGRLLDIFRQRLVAAERIDFFGSAGRDRVLTLLRDLDGRVGGGKRPVPAAAGGGPGRAASYQRRLWVTRPRPGVDRMASAWLIRRFIDPAARFGFAADRDAVPEDAVAFDMFGVELSHQADGCTFETLCSTFGIAGAAVSRLAAIVHDLDLKDGRFGAPENGAVAAIIDGLRLSFPDDDQLLEQGMTLFDSLYRSFEQATRPTGPRLSAKPGPSRERRPGRTRRSRR